MTTGHVHVLQPSNINYVRMVDITGVDGTLTAIGVASGKNYHYFRITIDGNVVADDLLTGSNATVAAANTASASRFLFDHSLLVEVRDAPSPSALTKYWAAWVTSHTETIGEGGASYRGVCRPAVSWVRTWTMAMTDMSGIRSKRPSSRCCGAESISRPTSTLPTSRLTVPSRSGKGLTQAPVFLDQVSSSFVHTGSRECSIADLLR